MVHPPAVALEERRDPPIAVAPELRRESDNRPRQRVFIVGPLRRAPLRRAMLTQNPASPPPGDAELAARMINKRPTARGP
jgi:hypothetical protein